MKFLKLVSVAMLIWGTSQASASLTSGEGTNLAAQVREIQARTAHLNQFFPQLKVKLNCSLQKAQTINAALRELKLLEDLMHGTAPQPMDPLIHLACTRPECGGGGGGGSCKTCVAPDDLTNPGRDTL